LIRVCTNELYNNTHIIDRLTHHLFEEVASSVFPNVYVASETSLMARRLDFDTDFSQKAQVLLLPRDNQVFIFARGRKMGLTLLEDPESIVEQKKKSGRHGTTMSSSLVSTTSTQLSTLIGNGYWNFGG
jgi:hypothetical protein